MATTATGIPEGGAERLHALDAVRAGALMLGVVFHATMSFLPGQQIWATRDEPSPTLAVVFFVSHIFRMTLFLLLAGFFARLVYGRRGLGGFVRDRLKRIGIPLLTFWPPSIVTITAAFIGGVLLQHGAEGAKAMAPPPAGGSIVETFPLTHLWFLYVLLWLYAAMLFGRGLVALFDRGERLRRGVDRIVRFLVTSGLAPLLLAAPTALALHVKTDWLPFFGVPTPDRGLVPNAQAVVAFASAFAFGWLLHRQADLLRTFERRWPSHLAVAVALSAVCLSITGLTIGLDPATQPAAQDPIQRLAVAVCYPLATWAWSFGLLGLALRMLSRGSAAIRYVADASYWIYLVHLPLVLALQVAVLRLPLPALVKFALVLAVALPILFLSYEWLVRHSFVGAILNGRRYPRRSRGGREFARDDGPR